MKFTPAQLKRFTDKPDDTLRALLIFGADEGLVRERATAVARAIVDDPKDPFRVTELEAAGLTADPARLADEAAAISMIGGRRLVRISRAGDRMSGLFKEFLANPPGDGFILVTADDLGRTSSLRKAFEEAPNSAVIECGYDSAETVDGLIDHVLAPHGLTVSEEARMHLRASLGGDRMISRQELEKLALYMQGEGTSISLEDARACVGDSSAEAFDAVGNAAARGDLKGLIAALAKAEETGESSVGLIRLTTRRLQRLHLVASMAERGTPLDAAFKALKPPAFQREGNEMRQLLNRWTVRKLADALALLLEAEMMCKTTGMPADAITARAMMRLAVAARRN
ncbi:DNA polymerase III subunit delta [Iodidimonas sp. SYSU 1G8]|uniref:DNA polymerase III subunit delta n=1 Tax=Iodidimonas sp. SYSU 1G8 TaxID=3133967 RepID=UPI0031FF38EE